MKEVAIVILIFLGFIVGVWMAIENRKLFELPFPVDENQKDMQQGVGIDRIAVGMENWQVKEVMGVPDKRDVVLETEKMRKEQWTYGKKVLYFTNGVLISWQER